MEIKLFKPLLIVLVPLVLVILYLSLNFSENQVSASEIEIPNEIFFEPLSMPGRIEGTGTYFEIKDSQYLNIVLKSSEEIKVVLESVPRMISINIEASSSVTSAILTLEGLEPNKTYYQYQDSYKNEAVFILDSTETYSWTQDLTQPHHIWIQEERGTIYIYEDTILAQNISGSVEIFADNITLDCNNYSITGNYSGYGIYLNSRQGAVIKNCNITHFSTGIYLKNSSHLTLENSIISENAYGACFVNSSDNTFMNNKIFNNVEGIYIPGSSSHRNTFRGNDISNNISGIYFGGSNNNFLFNNFINSNRDFGIDLECSSNHIIERNTISSTRGIGIYLFGNPLCGTNKNNLLIGNFFLNNDVGIALRPFNTETKIYHNNFINNIKQAAILSGSDIFFDDNYPSGGNYWSDYVGEDSYSGPNQDRSGSDGIGDTSYAFEGGQDRFPFMQENGWEGPPPEEPEKWSFAIITDLHIGRGYLDYGGEGDDDYAKPWLGKEEIAGQSYYLTERLKKVVKWINENNRMDNIKFAVVLGDITDSGEYSEFKKVKEILDGLEIPYFPLIGNHDVWSWYARQDGNSRVYKFPEIPVGDTYFNMIFDEVFFEQQFKNLGVTWREKDGDPLLQNYAFSYGGINFIALDFIQRDPGTFKTYKAVVHDITKNFLKNWLEIPPAGNPSILLSHHPLAPIKKVGELIDVSFGDDDLNSLEREIAGWGKVMVNFSGHVHGLYDELHTFTPTLPGIPDINPIFMNANIDYKEQGYVTPGGIPVVTTEILPVASNEQDLKGIVRIVEIEGSDRASNYDLIKGEFHALNPFFKEIEWDPRFTGFPPRKVWKVEFELYAFTKLYPLFYTLNFGDNLEESVEAPGGVYPPVEIEHHYPKEGGTYKVEFRAKKPVLSVEEKITRDITLPRWSWGYFLSSPADIVLTDPSGLTISKQISEIPGAFYFETDLDEDSDLDDMITLPERKIGDYNVTVLPESEANVTDVYTLGVLTEDEVIIPLAQNVKISDIPLQPYIVRSTETEITPIIPATADFDPDTLNLKSKGQEVTVYIELPRGHGYGPSLIDLKSLWLNNQVQADVRPGQVGDYDSDGIPDLIVKFNRSAMQSTLQVGEKIKITITGKLIDGRLFEGIDFIRVISP